MFSDLQLVMPKMVSAVVFWIKDLTVGISHLYGVGYDKTSYVRSDDLGLTWKLICQTEFDTVCFFSLNFVNFN